MRYSKKTLIVFVALMVELAFVLGVAIFDMIQFILINKNSAKLSPLFVPINISLIVVVGLSLLTVISMFVIKIIKGKKNEFKKD
jgi:hypothetical protein